MLTIRFLALVLLYLLPHSLTLAQPSNTEQKEFEKLTQQANAGDAIAQYTLGEMYWGEFDATYSAIAAQWFKASAEQGNPQAQLNYGLMHINGDGVEKDREKALFWITSAAEKGNSEASYFLGDLYTDGSVIGRDPEQAAKWFKKAAEQYHKREYCRNPGCLAKQEATFRSLKSSEDMGRFKNDTKLSNGMQQCSYEREKSKKNAVIQVEERVLCPSKIP